jgi:biopolymer transport protein ExbD
MFGQDGNGMFGGGRKRPSPEPDLIAMINVVFLLLIFFMTAGHLAPTRSLETRLPEAGPDASYPYARGLEIDVAKNGAASIQDIVFPDLASLSRALRDVKAEYPAGERLPHVNLRADGDARAELVLPVLEDVERLGFTGVRLTVKTGG